MTFSPELDIVVDKVLHGAYEMRRDGMESGSLQILQDSVFELGWQLVGIPESRGGSGGDLYDLAEIAAGIGRSGALAPVLETAVAQWLFAGLSDSGLLNQTAVVSIATGNPGQIRFKRFADAWTVEGYLTDISWLAQCDYVLLFGDDHSGGCRGAMVPRKALNVDGTRTDFFGIPVGDGYLESFAMPASLSFSVDFDLGEVRRRAEERSTLLKAAMMVGAAERACSLTAEHVRNRKQFGSELARLQSVAHALASAVAEKDLMMLAVSRAIACGGDGPAVPAASAVVARSAGHIAATCHQLHGAIGITQEYPLHVFTRPLWAGRDRLLSQRECEYRTGLMATTFSEDDVWSMIVDDVGEEIG